MHNILSWLRGKCKACDARVAEAEAKLASEETRNKDLQRVSKATIESLELNLRSKTEECNELFHTNTQLHNELIVYKGFMDKYNALVAQDWEAKYRELSVKYDKLVDEMSDLRVELGKQKSEYKLLKEAYDRRGTELVERNEEVKKLEASIKVMDEERTMQANQIQKLSDDKRRLEEEKAELYHKCEDLQVLLEKRTEEMDVMEDRATAARIKSGKVKVEEVVADVEKRRKSVAKEAKKRAKGK